MAKKNTNLHNAKKAKNDEFYTQYEDIENELWNYKDFFKGKIVFCNCDDARESNFFQYFANRFEFLGLKKLICIGYKENGKGILLEYEGDKNGNNMVDEEEIIATELEGNGDFRSEESIKYLKECDVVVTNPPFSLFREYIAQLMEYGKKFLIIGNQNTIINKDIFPYIKNNELWLGVNLVKDFVQPNGEIKKFGNVCWYTNIPHKKRIEELVLYKEYSAEKYPKYDNYDAIEVSRTENIPMDYEGVMGVPITFLNKYCPTQFEILGVTNNTKDNAFALKENTIGYSTWASINGKNVYARILIRKRVKNTDTSTDNGTEVANIITDNTPNEVVEEKKSFFKRIKVILNKINCAFLTLSTILDIF